MTDTADYGEGSATYDAVGGADGVKALIDAFYDLMSTDPRFKTIWDMHGRSNSETRDRLTRFLSGWMGGPRSYSATYGPINIPGVHAHLDITHAERDLWLTCMQQAMKTRNLPQSLQTYLAQQLHVPATRIVERCARSQGQAR